MKYSANFRSQPSWRAYASNYASNIAYATGIALVLLCTLLSKNAYSSELEEVLVTAELIEKSVLQLPNSVTLIDSTEIENRHARQLEDLLNLAPNVNFASGASRGKFIQIRGIGERSEFQEPINSSVGVVLDGIDLTGISLGATTLDLQQVEVLRGPQGTLYGANALAGLLNLVSNDPTPEFDSRLTFGIESYNGFTVGGHVSDSLSDSTGYRIAVNNYSSDGYVENLFLGTDDTNDFDETSARAKIVSQLNSRTLLTSTLFIADIDNGYDAFSLDNTRQTYSDNPGRDAQQSVAASVRADYQLDTKNSLELLLSHADTSLEYGFDEDWSHPGICSGTPCDSSIFGFDWFYASTDQYFRDNVNTTVDAKWTHYEDHYQWVAGIYHRTQSIDLRRDYTYNDDEFRSSFDTDNTAVYGQLNLDLNSQWSLVAGARVEQRKNRYNDSDSASANPSESLWGGKIAIEYHPESIGFYYALISRGYKPGGFNLDQAISPQLREFDTETMLNYELGYKGSWLDERLQIQLALFYQDRTDVQSKQSFVTSIATGLVGGTCPCSFTDFTANATSGSNKGVELELSFAATDRLSLYSSIGLLNSSFDTFLTFEHINADRDAGVPFDLSGRAQAHAPSYQFVLGGQWQLSPSWQIITSIEGKDEFFFSDRHDEQSDAYELLNIELKYSGDNWTLGFYAKNVTDELVKTRGFGSFGNDPRKFYQLEPYNQYAAPRIVGLRAQLDF